MTTPDQETPPAGSATPLRAFLVAEGPGMEAEIARQAGPEWRQPNDFVIVMTSPKEWTLPNGEFRRASRDRAEPFAKGAS